MSKTAANIHTLIEKAGGPATFSRALSIPLRTVEDWKAGVRTPPPWLPIIIEKALKIRKETTGNPEDK